MKKIASALLLLALGGTVVAQKAPATHVVIITVDGFRPEFYLDSTYGMMNVRELMKNGVAAKGVDPVFPSVTYPDHTTIVTGVTPAKHGIYYNTPFEPEGATGKWLWNYNLIKTDNLWSAMHKAGKTTACVHWPVTVGAPIDYRIPEFWDYKNKKDARAAIAAETAPASLWKEVQDSATGYLQADDLNAEENELVQDENHARMAAYLIRKYKPNFLAVHLACTDHYEHQDGRESYMVRAAVAGADRSIKTILEAVNRAGLKDSTLFIVTGDHGFENVYRHVQPNYLLKAAGLMNNPKKGDWKAMFHNSGGGAFLELKDPNDKATLAKVKEVLQNQPDSIKKYYQVLSKADLDKVGAEPAIQLGLTAINGAAFGGNMKAPMVVLEKTVGTHGYYPDHKEIKTGFVAFGPGLKKGTVINNMQLLDVTPLVVNLTGISFPKTDGQLQKDLLQ